MGKAQVMCLLRCPDAGLVNYALDLANLSKKERLAVELCGRQRYTQEEAAEVADVSVEAIAKWYAAGMKQLEAAWAGSWWIRKIVGEG